MTWRLSHCSRRGEIAAKAGTGPVYNLRKAGAKIPIGSFSPFSTRWEISVLSPVKALAKVSEYSTGCCNSPHRLSTRAAMFTACPKTVKSIRSAEPTLPYCTAPKCNPMPKTRQGACNQVDLFQIRIAEPAGRGTADGKQARWIG